MEKEVKKIILIPTDFSEVCQNATEHGLILAKAMKCEVTLLHVINKATHKYLDEENLDKDSIKVMMKKSAKEYTEKYNIPVNVRISQGKLFEKIKKINKKIKPILIILGTHGKLGFQKIAGSYVLKIITSTKTPTVVVQKKSNI